MLDRSTEHDVSSSSLALLSALHIAALCAPLLQAHKLSSAHLAAPVCALVCCPTCSHLATPACYIDASPSSLYLIQGVHHFCLLGVSSSLTGSALGEFLRSYERDLRQHTTRFIYSFEEQLVGFFEESNLGGCSFFVGFFVAFLWWFEAWDCFPFPFFSWSSSHPHGSVSLGIGGH